MRPSAREGGQLSREASGRASSLCQRCSPSLGCRPLTIPPGAWPSSRRTRGSPEGPAPVPGLVSAQGVIPGPGELSLCPLVEKTDCWSGGWRWRSLEGGADGPDSLHGPGRALLAQGWPMLLGWAVAELACPGTVGKCKAVPWQPNGTAGPNSLHLPALPQTSLVGLIHLGQGPHWWMGLSC